MFQFDRKQIKIIGLLCIIVALIAYVAFKRNLISGRDTIGLVDGDPSNSIDNNGDNNGEPNEDEQRDEQTKEANETIKIYVAGQVQNPGVIEVPAGYRLNEAIEMVGGFLADADLLRVNLALRVQDEGMYIIPKIGEESPQIDASISWGQNSNDKVNINTADQAQLETLPNIGPVIARNIIDYREENGPFEREEDLMNVPRIGQKTFDGLKEHITK